MKKIHLIVLLALLCGHWCLGQEVKPGQQAQGYLSGKHGTVDRSTGIFHYSVPLYTVGTGDFSVGLSADYAAKGVKKEDVPGLLGYNWTLNTGGIVTRTVRGGIPDEKVLGGYLFDFPQGTGDLPITAINQRTVDGESDIFTAVFNGRSVSFVLEPNEDRRIRALPLEKTGVRIEAIDSTSFDDGWVVTDEMGNKYFFTVAEWSKDVLVEDGNSNGSSRNDSYISSWHLSRIEPHNGLPVVYSYEEGTYLQKYLYEQPMTYEYGIAMREYPFDFESVQEAFNTAIRTASGYLQNTDLGKQMEEELYIFVERGKWIRHPAVEDNWNFFQTNRQVAGQILDYQDMGEATIALAEQLDELSDYYLYLAPDVSTWLQRAKSLICLCANETRQIYERGLTNGVVLRTESPHLTSIACGLQSVEFSYFPERNQLSSVCQSYDGVMKSAMTFQSGDTLASITYFDRTEYAYKQIAFEYYESPGGNIMYDLYGYPHPYGEWELGTGDVDCDYAQTRSLKKILLPDRGEIRLEYESNTWANGSLELPFGGIRLKRLIAYEPVYRLYDTMRYEYSGGRPVYKNLLSEEEINYGGFSDVVRYSRLKPAGESFLSSGNNGLYYRKVSEIQGKGKRTYIFNVPQRYGVIGEEESEYYHPFWAFGLPLAVADYDEDGRLEKVTENYYTNDTLLPLAGLDMPAGYLPEREGAYRHAGWLRQIKAYGFYANGGSIENSYKSMKTVQTGCGSINPYTDIYLPNLQARKNVEMPENQEYRLYYGGLTRLAEQREYRFDPAGNYAPDVLEVAGSYLEEQAGILVRKTAYFYDNPTSTQATRVETEDIYGDTRSVVTERVCDIAPEAGEAIAAMQEDNVTAPVVRQVTSVNGKIVREDLNLYDAGGLPVACYSYMPAGTESYAGAYPCTALKRDGVEYVREDTLGYTSCAENFRQPWWGMKKDGTLYGFVYDGRTHLPVLRLTNGKGENAIAVNLKDGTLEGSYYLYNQEGKQLKRYDVTVGSGEDAAPVLQVSLLPPSGNYSLELDESASAYRCIVIVPEDAEFEACWYDTDGTLRAAFDHNGLMEGYEYIYHLGIISKKTTDQDGNPVREEAERFLDFYDYTNRE